MLLEVFSLRLLALLAVIALQWPATHADLLEDNFPYEIDRGMRVYLAKRARPAYPGILPGDLLVDRAIEDDASADPLAGNDDNDDEPGTFNGRSKEVYLLEDKDYPKSVFENYDGIGQVSGLAALPSGDLAVFHRSDREWTLSTFRENNSIAEAVMKAQDNLIRNNTIMIIDDETGRPKLGFGSNLFYMPHGIASDSRGNLWVTDVGRHQVMRLPTSMIHKLLEESSRSEESSDNGDDGRQHHQRRLSGHLSRLWPDMILGEAFVPGSDEGHFCKPSEVVVSSDDRLVFVADGYCNKRIMVFTGEGMFLKSFGERENMLVVHSLALIEDKNLLCVADREKGRILCFKAGLDGDRNSLGKLAFKLNYPIGRVFALATIDANHLLVSGNQFGTSKFDLAALNPFQSTIKQVWTSSDLLTPHSLASTRDGRYVYAADLSREAHKKVFKFYVIREE